MADSPDGRTDAELLRENAETAFSEVYRRHAASVHAWFRRRLDWAARNLTAETFAQAVRGAARDPANLALLSLGRQHRGAAVKPGITVEGFDGAKK
jgi:hypothetical protein